MKELDRVFSKFIRLRDSFPSNHFYRIWGNCSTCKKKVLVWEIGVGYNDSAHCGHFVCRTHQATRHDEQNAHLQCAECNILGLGKPEEMADYIDKKYGKGTAESLIIKSKKLTKLFPHEKKELLHFYRKKVNELERNLGIC